MLNAHYKHLHWNINREKLDVSKFMVKIPFTSRLQTFILMMLVIGTASRSWHLGGNRVLGNTSGASARSLIVRRERLRYYSSSAPAVPAFVGPQSMTFTLSSRTKSHDTRMGTFSSIASTQIRSSTLRSLSSSTRLKAKVFEAGDHVQVEVDGAQYEGWVRRKNGGWYTVEIRDEDGKDTSIVKRRGTQLSPLPLQEQLNNDDSTNEVASDLGGKMKMEANTNVHVHVDAKNIPELLDQNLSSPTIIDLDALLLSSDIDPVKNKREQAYVEQCRYFSKIEKWVTFTDLHCAPGTMPTCLNVLSTVHAAAKREGGKTGVLFLGDFWHHRGTVRVDCLNAVLKALSEWEVPMIMLPGNHDQVSLGGAEHALTPLQNAYRVLTDDASSSSVPGILIFSHPTKFQNALFVPHIRDTGTMQSVLQSNVSASSSAVFVHADVTGAYMNDAIVSTHGIAPAYFPPYIPIYSGHFHKPHVVEKPEAAPGVSIRYVGSPYETTLAEAGQEKKLLVLDSSQNWQCVHENILSLGRKHWRIKSIDDLLDLQVMNDLNVNDSLPGPVSNFVSAGDRVVVSVNQEDVEELRRNAKKYVSDISGAPVVSAFDTKVKELRSIGASVEIRETRAVPVASRIDGVTQHKNDELDDLDWLLVEDMSPLTTWENYLDSEVKREALKNSTADIILEAGNKILEELGCAPSESDNMGQVGSFNGTSLMLEEITVEGFGPFQESTTYPLQNRGLVLLRGSNRDGGSDSNGSGKSTLAMSALWGLTGSIDPRPVQDSKVSDVIHDNAKTARVTIKGKINGKSFIIARSKSSSKGNLTFILNGEDLTKQSAKETQACIDETLGANSQVLSRSVFHGQHTINGLLEASDAKLKDELSIIVPLDIWQKAAAWARKEGRGLSKRVSELDGMVSIRNGDIDLISQKYENSLQIVSNRERILADRENELRVRLQNLESLNENRDFSIDALQHGLNDVAKNIKLLEAKLDEGDKELETELSPLRSHLASKRSELNSYSLELQNIQRQSYGNELSLASARDNLKSLRDKFGVIGNDLNSISFADPDTCPTCKQPLADDSHEHFIAEVKESLLAETSKIESLTSMVEVDQVELEAKQSLSHELEAELKGITSEIENIEARWNGSQASIREELQTARSLYSQRSEEFTNAMKRRDAINELEMLKSNSETELNALRDAVRLATETRDEIAMECEKMRSGIQDLETERETARSEAALMSSSAENFGARGVQTFILQNTVHALQLASQSYLDELSDGCIKLELALDTGDKILRKVSVLSSNGAWVPRPLSSLSGGQWRRCSLALSLGFSDLVARRGRLCSSLLVLDEPLTHLDSSGRDNVGKLLRKIVQRHSSNESNDGMNQSRVGGLSVSTILIILQDLVAEELSESFDCIDEVVKYQGHSKVIVDEARVLMQ